MRVVPTNHHGETPLLAYESSAIVSRRWEKQYKSIFVLDIQIFGYIGWVSCDVGWSCRTRMLIVTPNTAIMMAKLTQTLAISASNPVSNNNVWEGFLQASLVKSHLWANLAWETLYVLM